VKLTSGSSRLAEQVDVDELLRQAAGLNALSNVGGSHPLLVHRIAHLKTWHIEEDAQKLLQIARYLIQSR
jgi:hypothetical protein